MNNVNGNNLSLSFVSINSESNVQETGKGTYIAEKGNLNGGERPCVLLVMGGRTGALSCFIRTSLCADSKPRWEIKGL